MNKIKKMCHFDTVFVCENLSVSKVTADFFINL